MDARAAASAPQLMAPGLGYGVTNAVMTIMEHIKLAQHSRTGRRTSSRTLDTSECRDEKSDGEEGKDSTHVT